MGNTDNDWKKTISDFGAKIKNEILNLYEIIKNKLIKPFRNAVDNNLDGKTEEKKLNQVISMAKRKDKELQIYTYISCAVFSVIGILGLEFAFIVAIIAIIILLYLVFFLKACSWKEKREELEEKRNTENQETINAYEKRIKELECQLDIMYVLPEIINLQNMGKTPIELEEYLLRLTLEQLIKDQRDGYSVAIYHCISDKTIMGGYHSNIMGDPIPTIYRKVLEKRAQKKEYCSFKCIGEQKECSKILLTRTQITKELKNASTRFNQYANRLFRHNDKHCILLEIIAYDNTVFLNDESKVEEYIDELLNKFGYLFLWVGRDILIEQYA